jgi:hypothetical protein
VAGGDAGDRNAERHANRVACRQADERFAWVRMTLAARCAGKHPAKCVGRSLSRGAGSIDVRGIDGADIPATSRVTDPGCRAVTRTAMRANPPTTPQR